MAEIVSNNGEIEKALPADLQFFRKANTNGIIGWFSQNAWNENARRIIPKVWHLLEKRIREHPNEAREVDEGNGNLPIHHVLWVSRRHETKIDAAPLSLIQLLIELHRDGLHIQTSSSGCIPLHFAFGHPCIDCFRAVLYNGGVEATTIQTSIGSTPLHWSAEPCFSLASRGETPLAWSTAPIDLLVLPCCGSYCALTMIALLFRMIVAGRTALEFLEDD